MPTPSTARKAKQDLKQGKSPSTAAGEFVYQEIEHVRHASRRALAAPADRHGAE